MGEVSTEKALGQAIQTARQNAGLTQQELCHQAQLSYSTLAKIERGAIKTPSVFTVASIARVLGRTMDDLLGAVVDTSQKAQRQKKISKNGTSFVYFDINGCLVRFFHAAFTHLSRESGIPNDVIESTFWHYNDAVCKGELTMAEFNTVLADKLGVPSVDWSKQYLEAVEPIEEMREVVAWAATHYKIGLLSNIMPGLIDEMIKSGILPQVSYDVIVDSSVVGAIKPELQIYEIAQQKAGVNPEEILFVDDSRTNLMAAEHTGWRVLWFDDYKPNQSAQKIKEALSF